MVTDEQIEAILSHGKLSGASYTQTSDGLYNTSYYLKRNNERYVLRVAPGDSVPKLFYEIDMMRSEPEIHRLVRKHTGVPVPEVICYDFSREIIDTDWMILQFMPGTPGYFNDEDLGRYTREIHEIQGEIPGYPERAAETGEHWPDLFIKYAELIFRDCLNVEVISRGEYDWFTEIYRKHKDSFKQITPSLLHLDLWSQNILTLDGRITAILDFDRGLYGDPELEFAVNDANGLSTEGFFRGYGKERPYDRDAQIRQKLYIVYELIKYAHIRTARGGSYQTGRRHVTQCRELLSSLD